MGINIQAACISPQLIPSPEEAVRQYEEAGGHITHFRGFGEDPLANHATLVISEKRSSIKGTQTSNNFSTD